ncbi:MAG: hypothetical protein Q8M06_01715, partial [Methanobacteriaceae archaeon]|nr:hypothetical protein [Methanobacteriaceae archaeon]
MKKIRRQKITKKDNSNSIKIKSKIIVPLLLLALVLVVSCTVNDVAATEELSNDSTLSNAEEDLEKTDQYTTNNSNNESSDSLNSENNQTLPDPQIYNGGVPVARGGNPAGYIYPTISAAIADALSGDTIMLEAGAVFNEFGLIIDKNLNFNVFSNGYATINGGNTGTIFIINDGITATLRNLILINGQGTLGGAIYNNGTLTVNNCVFSNNMALDGGAIYNGGIINYIDETLNSITVTLNGGTLTVNNSTFTNNIATRNGGAIYNGGTINITRSTLTSVTLTQNGGTLDVTNSTFTGN